MFCRYVASFFAGSSEGNRISHVTKLRRQKYRHGMPTDLKTSLKAAFLIPISLLVFRSVTTKDRVFGSTASVNLRIVKISFSLKYGAYMPTLSFSYSLGNFFFFFWLTRSYVLFVALRGFVPFGYWVILGPVIVYLLQPIYLEGGVPCLMKRGRFVMVIPQ